MILGELREMLSEQLGPTGDWGPTSLDQALTHAMEHLATEASLVGKGRLLYSVSLDLIEDKQEYELPKYVRTVKGVDRLDWLETSDEAVPLTPVSFVQRAHATESDFWNEPTAGSFRVYWVTHRTLHIRPAPTSDEPGKLRVWCYAVPPLPTNEESEVPIPPECVRFIILRAAQLILPSPNRGVLQTLRELEPIVMNQLQRWLRDVTADVSPHPAAESYLGGV